MIIRTRCKPPSFKAIAPRNTSLASPLKGFIPRGDQIYTNAFLCFRGSAKIRKEEGGSKRRDAQIHFSITQLTAPWENKSKKCATLKCVHAARDIFNVNPVF